MTHVHGVHKITKKEGNASIKRAFPLFYISICSAYASFLPQPVIKIFRFDIEQIVMEWAYNKIRCMQQ